MDQADHLKRENYLHFDLLQLLHLNNDQETWNDNFHDFQLLTTWDDARFDPMTRFRVESKASTTN